MPKVTISKKLPPMHEELCGWLLQTEGDTLTQAVIAKQIASIKRHRGLFPKNSGVTYQEYQGFINKCRAYLETNYRKTLINIRIPGESYGCYRIATEEEATLYGVHQYKRFMLQADRVRRITPLMHRKYIWPSVKKVFGEAESEAQRFHRLGEKFLLAYSEDVKEIKAEAKEAAKAEKE